MSRRITELDGLRALAILAVFVGHSLKVRMMWIGVDLFFILSGFLITGILLDMPKVSFGQYIGEFYSRRVRRILPPYVLLLVLASIVFGIGWMHYWYMYLGLMNYAGLIPGGSLPDALGPLWSLAVEEQFYFVWPLLVFFLARKTLPKVLIGILLVEPLLRGAVAPWLLHQPFDQYHWFVYRGTVFRADTLAMGALLTFVWRSHPEKIRKYGPYGLVLTALMPPVMILLNRYGHGFSTFEATVQANIFTYEFSLLAMTGLFVWALSGRFTAILTLKPMLWVARISYTFYLVHEGMLMLATSHFKNLYVIALSAGVGAILLAQLSWLLLERPILHGGNRKQRQRELAAATDVDPLEAGKPRQV